MRESDLQYLACPSCLGDLSFRSIAERRADVIVNGELACAACGKTAPVIGAIPRLGPMENYTESFGLEWTIHASTQYDHQSGVRNSEDRYFKETGWPRRLDGEVILEVGSGSGRFTEHAASTGAFVVSMDYSRAVETNYKANGHRPNVLIVQGDVFHLPFKRRRFDRLFCFGMLQHTPDPKQAFRMLPPMLKPGGELVVDVYKKTIFTTVLHTKYYARLVTKRMDPERLYRWGRRYVDLMWPLCRVVRRIPRIGPSINWRLLVADYSHLGLEPEQLKQWAYLDTFDMLSPRYDIPQTLGAVRRWFHEEKLTDVRVHYGYNGVEGHGKVPAAPAS